MEMLRSKATVALVIMILSVAFIGGVDNTNLKDSNTNVNEISANA